MAAEAKSVSINTYARVRRFFEDRESGERIVHAKPKTENGKKGLLVIKSKADDSIKSIQTE